MAELAAIIMTYMNHQNCTFSNLEVHRNNRRRNILTTNDCILTYFENTSTFSVKRKLGRQRKLDYSLP